jgi:hypothetical protein
VLTGLYGQSYAGQYVQFHEQFQWLGTCGFSIYIYRLLIEIKLYIDCCQERKFRRIAFQNRVIVASEEYCDKLCHQPVLKLSGHDGRKMHSTRRPETKAPARGRRATGIPGRPAWRDPERHDGLSRLESAGSGVSLLWPGAPGLVRASSMRLLPTSIVVVTTLYLWSRGPYGGNAAGWPW